MCDSSKRHQPIDVLPHYERRIVDPEIRAMPICRRRIVRIAVDERPAATNACPARILGAARRRKTIGRPAARQNGYCESFNGKLRDELLNGEIFYSLKEARIVIEQWRHHYNHKRPHSSLGYRPPAPVVYSDKPLEMEISMQSSHRAWTSISVRSLRHAKRTTKGGFGVRSRSQSQLSQ